jgi:putative mRNA 3-end processing factor
VIQPPVNVTAKSAVSLGQFVTCDGFIYDTPYRVQTHVHQDHMRDWGTSKGTQDIFMSKATRDLLIAEYGADLPYRTNVIGVDYGQPVVLPECQIELVPSGHMLGGAQVSVCLPDGQRLGYSSDFSWPLDQVIKVDYLVVDSTYGSPDVRRQYSQSSVNERFLELVSKKMRQGPLIIQGFRGTLERALILLDAEIKLPLVASSRFTKELEVYRKYGYSIGDFYTVDSSIGQELVNTRSSIRLVRKGEQLPEIPGAVTISLSAYMSDPKDPVMEYSESAYSIAMTDHADFDGTLSYIRETGAKHVVTDNCRGPYAVELANEVRRLLSIEAQPSNGEFTREWGA